MNVLISTLYNDLQNQGLLRRLNLVKSVVGGLDLDTKSPRFLLMREGKFVWIAGQGLEVEPEPHMLSAFARASDMLRRNGPGNVWERSSTNPVTDDNIKFLLNSASQRFAFARKELIMVPWA